MPAPNLFYLRRLNSTSGKTMKGTIEHAQTVIIVLIALVIVVLLIYLILFQNLVPKIINSLKFIINVFQGYPPT